MSLRALLVAGGLLAASGAGACALGPVESDPVLADQRAAKMQQDCFRRGGTWNTERRVCLGADPIR